MKKISILILLVVLSGCSSSIGIHRFHLNNGTELSSGPKVEKTSRFFFWGLVPTDDIDVISACGGDAGKVSDIVSIETVSERVLILITIGIYTPRTYVIYCKA